MDCIDCHWGNHISILPTLTMDEHSATYNVVNGLIGSAASALGVITQFQEQLDWALKTTSTSLLICVSLVTLYNLLKKKK